jgi:hypothetical protein
MEDDIGQNSKQTNTKNISPGSYPRDFLVTHLIL